MGRILILLLVLAATPFAAAALYEMSRDRAGWRDREHWARARLLKLALIGLALAAAGTLAMAVAMDPGGKTGRYEPARFENGKVVPGRIVPEAPDPQR